VNRRPRSQLRTVPRGPTPGQLARSHALFEAKEPRYRFYRVAIDLIRLGRLGETQITLGEALAVLLQTWNVSYYRFWEQFSDRHLRELEELLAEQARPLTNYRERQIEELTDDDQEDVEALFEAFESVLGTTGAAKALHLLAPRFFPLWDRPIATGTGCRHMRRGHNAPRYWQFMQIVRDQCERLGGEAAHGAELLKRLDEFYFCRYTRNWI
jgi:hypothetical protein